MLKLYSTHCPVCNAVIRVLTEKNIEFEEITNQEEIIDITFAGDYMIIFTSNESEPYIAICLKNNQTRIDNLLNKLLTC